MFLYFHRGRESGEIRTELGGLKRGIPDNTLVAEVRLIRVRVRYTPFSEVVGARASCQGFPIKLGQLLRGIAPCFSETNRHGECVLSSQEVEP